MFPIIQQFRRLFSSVHNKRNIRILFVAGSDKYGEIVHRIYDRVPSSDPTIQKILVKQGDQYYNDITKIDDPQSINSICIGNYETSVLPQIDFKLFTGLSWMQLTGVGFDVVYNLENLRNANNSKQLTVTNMRGAPSQALAEYGIFVCFYFLKQFARFKQFQNNKKWANDDFSLDDIKSIHQKKILILGLGNIGLTFSRLASVYGPSSIVGLKKSMSNRNELLDNNPQITEIDVLSMDSLQKHLPDSDIVYMSLPSHPSLADVINKDNLCYMKEGAILINVGRGMNIDEQALIETIKTKNIKVGLDVTKDEPYDQDYALLNDAAIQDNLIMTSHSIDACDVTISNYGSVVLRNIENYQNNRPLINQVELAKGY